MRRRFALAAMAAALLAGCHGISSPYREEGHANPPGQNPNGTPADRTGGARNVPDGAGPVINPPPAKAH
jgi:hypothetical protein